MVWLGRAAASDIGAPRGLCVLTRADDDRGWAIFEQGVSLFVVAHLNLAQKQGALPASTVEEHKAKVEK